MGGHLKECMEDVWEDRMEGIWEGQLEGYIGSLRGSSVRCACVCLPTSSGGTLGVQLPFKAATSMLGKCRRTRPAASAAAPSTVPSRRRDWHSAAPPHPPLDLAGFSIAMERQCQQNDSLADG